MRNTELRGSLPIEMSEEMDRRTETLKAQAIEAVGNEVRQYKAEFLQREGFSMVIFDFTSKSRHYS